jgi:hypothetical protein
MYKIFKKERYNEYGRIEYTRFIIKQRKSFLWTGYWRTINHSTYAGNTTMYFNSKEDAKEFIRDILCPNVPREKWIETPIEEVSCKY